MARKKVKLMWIVNDASRKATFKKRRKGLLKKVSELATLCDVRACAIIYGPRETRAEVWPSMEGAMDVLARFKSLPEMEQSKRMTNQEGFLRHHSGKLRDQLRKLERENREFQLGLLVHEAFEGRSFHDMGIEDMTRLAWMMEIKINTLDQRVHDIKQGGAATVNGVTAAAREKTLYERTVEALHEQSWLVENNVVFGAPPQGGQEITPAFLPFN